MHPRPPSCMKGEGTRKGDGERNGREVIGNMDMSNRTVFMQCFRPEIRRRGRVPGIPCGVEAYAYCSAVYVVTYRNPDSALRCRVTHHLECPTATYSGNSTLCD